MRLVVPAVLPSSKEAFADAIGRFSSISTVSRIQIDVVDGRFASPKCWPYTAPGELSLMVGSGEMLPHLERIDYEIDLMCLHADDAAHEWLMLGASRLTFHAESLPDISKFLVSIKKRYGDTSVVCGLALNIESDLALIEPHLQHVRYVQFMGIASIGKQGQPFDRRVLEKVRAFRKVHPDIPVQVDGGVTIESGRELVALGVSSLVVGSSLLRAPNLALAIGAFEDLHSPFGV